MLIWETVIWDMLTRASTPSSRATAAMVTVASRYPADTAIWAVAWSTTAWYGRGVNLEQPVPLFDLRALFERDFEQVPRDAGPDPDRLHGVGPPGVLDVVRDHPLDWVADRNHRRGRWGRCSRSLVAPGHQSHAQPGQADH